MVINKYYEVKQVNRWHMDTADMIKYANAELAKYVQTDGMPSPVLTEQDLIAMLRGEATAYDNMEFKLRDSNCPFICSMNELVTETIDETLCDRTEMEINYQYVVDEWFEMED